MPSDWINLFRQYLSLPIREQWLICETVVFLLVIQIGLDVASYSSLRGIVERFTTVFDGRFTPSTSRDRIRWVVMTSASVLPGTYTCLVRALAAELLLERCGYSATLQFGVEPSEDEFVAHAWVESGGVIVVGGDERSRFMQLK